jgi:2-polyprenyl-6-methoxyphenol hydroxylase-like FAD-dependent oxidoreductase
MASLPLSVEYLIVGGGPAGLTAAISLRKNGLQDIVVLDAMLGPMRRNDTNSRALSLWPATLEVFTISLNETIST